METTLSFADMVSLFLAAFLTLAIFSFLWKDNFFYKLGEALFVGSAVGYNLGLIYDVIIFPRWVTPIFYQYKFFYLIPTVIGAMYITRFSRKWSWLSRYPMAMLIGFGSGFSIPYAIQASIFKQVSASMLPLWSSAGFELNNLLMVIGVLTTLFYFFFSIEHNRKLVRIPVRIGIVFIMISFGATFGFTVMARFSLLIGRVNFLWYDWLGALFGFKA
ncbi:MAG: hypothetical protein WC712_04145 [Candidatus Brocadiia bacterium]